MFGGAAREVRPSLGYPPQAAIPQVDERPRRTSRLLAAVIAILAVLAVALVAVLVLQRVHVPGTGLAINEATFPDGALRAVVNTYDSNDDGALNAEELASITSLDCSSRNVSSLEGIDELTSLTSLNASNNRLSVADLSGNAALTRANLSGNRLTEVNLAGLSQLASLDVSNNQLASLDLSACAALSSLACTGNSLARLDLSHNHALTSLTCDEGQTMTIPIAEGFFPDAGLRASLTSLDSDGDGALSDRERSAATSLVVSDASTASLTGLSWLPNLATLDISGTQVSSLVGSELPSQLSSIVAHDSALASVDLAGLEGLNTLDVSNAPLTAVDLTPAARLTSLDIRGSQIAALDVTPCLSTLATLRCDASATVQGVVTRTSACFPDEALRSAVFSAAGDSEQDDMLTEAEVAAITELDLTGSGATDLTGLAQLGSLRSLNCSGLAIAGNAFSCVGLGQLQVLTLSGCGLTSIDLTGADSLMTLDASNNDLEALATGGAPNLAFLNATGNARLTLIDATGCAGLMAEGAVQMDEGCELVAGMAPVEEPEAPTE